MTQSSTAQRVGTIFSIVMNSIILLLSATGLIGVWVLRSATIDMTTLLIDDAAEISRSTRERIQIVQPLVVTLHDAVNQVDRAIAAATATDNERGTILGLLPPDIEAELFERTEPVLSRVEAVRDTTIALINVQRSIAAIPFLNVPGFRDEDVAKLDQMIENAGAAQQHLRTELRQFRDGVPGTLEQISRLTNEADTHLTGLQTDLEMLDSRLSAFETNAESLKGQIADGMTIFAIVMTVICAWLIYDMILLIRRAWPTLHR